MSLGPGVLVSRGSLALLPPFSGRVSLPRLAFCTVGNPFLSSMGQSQFLVIVEVVASVALLTGIAVSPWITVRYGWHRRKVIISFQSSLPRTST